MGTEESAQTEQYKRMVLDEWTDAATVAAWRKWHPKATTQLQAMTDALLEAAGVRAGLRVLDLASGTGQPAIDLARAVGPTGHVTATDLSAGMLAAAEEHARQAGLTNLTCRQADAHDLPFADGAFEVVTSRSGAMYFTDIRRALGEVRRVLAPGGRVALAVWGPADQGTFNSSVLAPFLRRVSRPPPPPDAPQPYRFAAAGMLRGELERAGFRAVTEVHRVLPQPWPGPPEECRQFFYDIAIPLRPLFDSLPPQERAAAVEEVVELLRAHYDGRMVNATRAAVLVSGMRWRAPSSAPRPSRRCGGDVFLPQLPHAGVTDGGSCRHSLIALRLVDALAWAERSHLLPAVVQEKPNPDHRMAARARIMWRGVRRSPATLGVGDVQEIGGGRAGACPASCCTVERSAPASRRSPT